MENSKSSFTDKIFSIQDQSPFLVILLACVVGALTGWLGSLFQIGITHITTWRLGVNAYAFGSTAVQYAAVFALTAAMGAGAYYLVRKFAPESSGSGIPEIEGALLDLRPVRWARVLPVKFFGGLLSLGSGMVLGREGPTVQMGANLGKMTSDALRLPTKDLQHTLVATGAGAGITAAFNAPLGGILFVIEEMRSEFKYSKASIKAVIAGCISSCVVYQWMISPNPILDIGPYDLAPLKGLWVYIFLGLFLGAVGTLSNAMILKTRAVLDIFYQKKSYYFPLVGALLAGTLGVVGIHHAPFVGGGFEIIPNVAQGLYAFWPLFVLFALRLIATVLCFGSGAPGGIFSPTLALGTVFGVLFGVGANAWFPALELSLVTCAILGMAGLFAATIRAPLTGIVIVIEMTGSYLLILPLLVTCVFATFMAQTLGAAPLYTAILQNTLAKIGIQLPKEG